MEAFQINNPLWFSDTFVFMKYDFDGHMSTVYVKLNNMNKIEEIGIDIISRLHVKSMEDMMSIGPYTKATRLQYSIINRFGEEYWWSILYTKRDGKNNKLDTINQII